MIQLLSSDGVIFDVEEVVAAEALTLKKMIEDGADGTITLPNVTSLILAKVIEYCKKHVEAAAKGGEDESVYDRLDEEDLKKLYDAHVNADKVDMEMLNDLINAKTPEHLKELKKFDADFVQVDRGTLRDLMKAANYLDIEGLSTLAMEALFI